MMPHALTLLGTAGPLVVATAPPDHYAVLRPTDHVLCTGPFGEDLYVVRFVRAAEPHTRDAEAEARATELRRAFVGRRKVELLGTVATVGRPGRKLGRLVLVQYQERKDHPGREWFEHYFEPEGQPVIHEIAGEPGSYYVAPGQFKVTARGIHGKGR